MNIQIRPEAKALIEREHHQWITLHADRECVGANCSESYLHPMLGFHKPTESEAERFDVFQVSGVTVFVDRELEILPEVDIDVKHHMLKDVVIATTRHEAPIMTHIKL
ncbi:MAG: hypothetical protein LCH34_10370 [Firmicutes bacterium]|nr:hypothetical protein [Bacillota bacterium]